MKRLRYYFIRCGVIVRCLFRTLHCFGNLFERFPAILLGFLFWKERVKVLFDDQCDWLAIRVGQRWTRGFFVRWWWPAIAPSVSVEMIHDSSQFIAMSAYRGWLTHIAYCLITFWSECVSVGPARGHDRFCSESLPAIQRQTNKRFVENRNLDINAAGLLQKTKLSRIVVI